MLFFILLGAKLHSNWLLNPVGRILLALQSLAFTTIFLSKFTSRIMNCKLQLMGQSNNRLFKWWTTGQEKKTILSFSLTKWNQTERRRKIAELGCFSFISLLSLQPVEKKRNLSTNVTKQIRTPLGTKWQKIEIWKIISSFQLVYIWKSSSLRLQPTKNKQKTNWVKDMIGSLIIKMALVVMVK